MLGENIRIRLDAEPSDVPMTDRNREYCRRWYSTPRPEWPIEVLQLLASDSAEMQYYRERCSFGTLAIVAPLRPRNELSEHYDRQAFAARLPDDMRDALPICVWPDDIVSTDPDRYYAALIREGV